MFVITQLARLLLLGTGTYLLITWIVDMITKGYSSDLLVVAMGSCFVLFVAMNPRR